MAPFAVLVRAALKQPHLTTDKQLGDPDGSTSIFSKTEAT